MKKFIALLLMAALCLSLVSCSIGRPTTSVEDDGVIDVEIDDGEIGGGDIIVSEEDETSSVIEYEMTPAMEFWLERLPGEYVGFPENEGDELQDVVINADRTCTFDGKEYTWDFLIGTNGLPTCDETDVIVAILDGNTTVHAFSASLHPMGFISGGICIPNEFGGIIDHLSGSYLNTAGLTVVELTLDNWQDYFEYVEEFSVRYHSSGEVDSASVDPHYQLKEEYGTPIFYYNDITFELIGKPVRQAITIDLENETYEWGDVLETYDPDEPITGEMEALFDFYDDHFLYYGYSLPGRADAENFPNDEVLWKHFEVTDIQGTLYCVPAE